MIKIKLKKLYQNRFADLRDYKVNEAINKKEPIVVLYGDKQMTLTPQALKERKVILNQKPFKSKVKAGQWYHLWSYLFEEDKKCLN